MGGAGCLLPAARQPGTGAPHRRGGEGAGSSPAVGGGQRGRGEGGALHCRQLPSALPAALSRASALPGCACLQRVGSAASSACCKGLHPRAPALLPLGSGEKPQAAGTVRFPSGERGRWQHIKPCPAGAWPTPALAVGAIHGAHRWLQRAGLRRALTGPQPSHGAFSLPRVPCAHRVPPLHLHLSAQGHGSNGSAGAGGRGPGSSCAPQGSAELLRRVGSGWQQNHRLHRAPAVLRCWSRCHGLSGTTGPGPRTPRCPAAPAVQAQCLPITILFGAAAVAVI